MKKYTDTEINLLRIALGMSGICINNPAGEHILHVIDGIKEKKGKFSLKDAAIIEVYIEKKYKKREVKK